MFSLAHNLVKINEDKYNLDINKKHSSKDLNEGKSFFEWVDIERLSNYHLLIDCLVDEIKKKDYSKNIKYIKYKK